MGYANRHDTAGARAPTAPLRSPTQGGANGLQGGAESRKVLHANRSLTASKQVLDFEAVESAFRPPAGGVRLGWACWYVTD
jgi:hypothetical protein